MSNPPKEPLIVPRDEHPISRNDICEKALKVLYRLKDCGYESFLVGGCVRDLLLGVQPKDFDVATNATPEEVRKAFRNCRLIGRRFRLAHIHFGRDYIEVATFRAAGDEEQAQREMDRGKVVSDNVYGTIEEDAERRDFTVNALYYNIKDFTVRDYVGGHADLKAGVLRLIGEPERRYLEDPVRLLRAIRFSAKLDLSIESETEKPLFAQGETLAHVPPARLFDEVLKLFLSGHAQSALEKLWHYGLFGHLFPQTAHELAHSADADAYWRMFRMAMKNTDERVRDDKPVTPAFLFATLLWPQAERAIREAVENGIPYFDAVHKVADDVIRRQLDHTSIPRRFSIPMRDIWQLQSRFEHRVGRRAKKLMGHPKFRAAYDFLLLRAEQDPANKEMADFWTEIQENSPDEIDRKLAPDGNRKKRRRPRRRGGGKRSRSEPAS